MNDTPRDPESEGFSRLSEHEKAYSGRVIRSHARMCDLLRRLAGGRYGLPDYTEQMIEEAVAEYRQIYGEPPVVAHKAAA